MCFKFLGGEVSFAPGVGKKKLWSKTFISVIFVVVLAF